MQLKSGLKYIFVSFSIMLAACNSGTGNSSEQINSQIKLKLLKKDNIDKMDINWTVDNNVKSDELNSSLKDMGWHIITMTVSSIDEKTQPTPVQGLLMGIYPTPPINLGQKILTQDINCANAVFSKVGDSCSAYFKLDYDTSKGSGIPVQFPIQMTAKGDISAVLSFTSTLNSNNSIVDYRKVNNFESQYYSGSMVASNPNAYQILLVQNGSSFPIDLTKIPTPSNPIFSIMHRTTPINSNDPYYGTVAECSLVSNPNIGQVNVLSNLNDSCIIIYKAAPSSLNTKETDSIEIGSNASNFFPVWGNKYILKAIYTTNTPIPPKSFTSLNGNFHTLLPFNSFDFSYYFHPVNLSVLRGSTTKTLIIPIDDNNIAVNMPVLTDKGKNIITSITHPTPEGTNMSGINSRVQNPCDFIYSKITANAFAYKALTFNDIFVLKFDIDTNQNCRQRYKEQFGVSVNLSRYDNIVYSHSDECSGTPSDFSVKVTGGCENNNCNYAITSTINARGWCRSTTSSTETLSFTKPLAFVLADLNSDNATPISFAGIGGQHSNGSMGSIYKPIAENVNCDTNGLCTANGTFSDIATSYDMGYQIILNQNDVLKDGVIKFNRSSGYELSNFNIDIGD